MKINWHGHACFSVESKDGCVVFDPYKEGSVPGLPKLDLVANGVYCSHQHSDHNDEASVTIKDEKVFNIDIVESFHDDKQGTLRGPNKIHVLNTEGMKVVHLGDLGCDLEDVSAIKNCDVLIIPVGGYFTINAEMAHHIINKIEPRIVIPMHYRSETFGYDVLDLLEVFTNGVEVTTYPTNTIEVTKETPNQIAILSL